MKKSLVVFLLVTCGFMATAINWKDKGAEPTPAKYESFEDGIPKTWILQGKGKLSLDPWHYKLGKKSLQWDFKAGDVIKINNTIGDPSRRGGRGNICFPTFGVWVYSAKPLKGKKLRFEFCTDDKRTAYFDFPINFKGWQCGYVCYRYSKNPKYLKGNVSLKTNNIRIKAPKDCDGTLMIDLLVYNGPRYSMFANILPNKEPWKAPTVNAEKYPLPDKVSDADLKAIERIKKELLPKTNITVKERKNKYFKKVLKNAKAFNIVEDEHGIRGVPLQVPRDHSGGEFWFYTYNGIPRDVLETYCDGILKGSRSNRWEKGILLKMPKAFAIGITKDQHQDILQENVKIWKFLLDQGFNTSYGYSNYYSGSRRSTALAIYLVRDALLKSGIMDKVFEYAQYKNYELFSKGKRIRSMDSFGVSSSLYCLVFIYSEDAKKQVQALRALTDRFNVDITGDYGSCGFKPDGCGYHCTGHGNGYTRNGLWGISKVAKVVSGSSFALSDKAFNVLKKCALRFCFYSNNLEIPIFMQGTEPFLRTWPKKYKLYYLPNILKTLALASKNGCDKQLAQAYVNSKPTDTAFAKKYNLKPTKAPEGNISMPYMPIVAQRRNGWLAVAHGGGIDMRSRGNHYMYHGGNGALAILGTGGFFDSGSQLEGWDWNRTNGTTCLYMPDLTSIKYIHAGRKVPKGKRYLLRMRKEGRYGKKNDPIIKRGNGGISWRGINGCFRKKFRGDRLYNDFGGLKSYFFINDRIYALGSNLKSDNKKYHVQTNLYQKALFKTVKASVRKWEKAKLTEAEKDTYVDGEKLTSFPVADKELNAKKVHYLIDPQGNGYFVPAGQKLFVARKTQKSKGRKGKVNTVGDFATAWLDHGIACQDGKYVYVVMPYCDKGKFAKFSDKDFEILRQDNFAHILHDKIDGFYAGIFFKGGNVKKLPHVNNVERDCQIMYKESNGKLEIAVGDPDVHRNWTDKLFAGSYGGKSELTPLKVTFTGLWKLDKPVDGLKILSSNKSKTVIEFACIHGKTFNFTLVK